MIDLREELRACKNGGRTHEDRLNIFIRRSMFEEFEIHGPEENVLSLREYMYLYKFITQDGSMPSEEYQYKVYRFRADDIMVLVEGWVPKSERNLWKWPQDCLYPISK